MAHSALANSPSAAVVVSCARDVRAGGAPPAVIAVALSVFAFKGFAKAVSGASLVADDGAERGVASLAGPAQFAFALPIVALAVTAASESARALEAIGPAPAGLASASAVGALAVDRAFL